jgi:hypothetical protein
MNALHRLAGTQLDLRPTRYVYVEGDRVWAMPLFGGRSVALRVEPPSASQAKPTATIAHRFHIIGVIAAVAWVYVMIVAALVLL